MSVADYLATLERVSVNVGVTHLEGIGPTSSETAASERPVQAVRFVVDPLAPQSLTKLVQKGLKQKQSSTVAAPIGATRFRMRLRSAKEPHAHHHCHLEIQLDAVDTYIDDQDRCYFYDPVKQVDLQRSELERVHPSSLRFEAHRHGGWENKDMSFTTAFTAFYPLDKPGDTAGRAEVEGGGGEIMFVEIHWHPKLNDEFDLCEWSGRGILGPRLVRCTERQTSSGRAAQGKEVGNDVLCQEGSGGEANSANEDASDEDTNEEGASYGREGVAKYRIEYSIVDFLDE